MNRTARCLLLFAALPLALGGCGSNTPEIDPHEPLQTLAMLEADHKQHASQLYMEVDMGEFFVVKKQDDSPYGLGVSCHLYGVIPHNAEGEFSAVWDQRQQRMRDSIIILIQQAETEMLVGSDLELLKADLLKTCRQSLQSNLLQRVVISDFSVVQH